VKRFTVGEFSGKDGFGSHSLERSIRAEDRLCAGVGLEDPIVRADHENWIVERLEHALVGNRHERRQVRPQDEGRKRDPDERERERRRIDFGDRSDTDVVGTVDEPRRERTGQKDG